MQMSRLSTFVCVCGCVEAISNGSAVGISGREKQGNVEEKRTRNHREPQNLTSKRRRNESKKKRQKRKRRRQAVAAKGRRRRRRRKVPAAAAAAASEWHAVGMRRRRRFVFLCGRWEKPNDGGFYFQSAAKKNKQKNRRSRCQSARHSLRLHPFRFYPLASPVHFVFFTFLFCFFFSFWKQFFCFLPAGNERAGIFASPADPLDFQMFFFAPFGPKYCVKLDDDLMGSFWWVRIATNYSKHFTQGQARRVAISFFSF